MKPFGKWFADTADEQADRLERSRAANNVSEDASIDLKYPLLCFKYCDWYDLLEPFNSENTLLEDLVYPCVVCQDDALIYVDPSCFDPEYHYCGKNRRCCP